ncbi:MAG: hypothetical protein WC960_06450 [Bacteroidales bacterium]
MKRVKFLVLLVISVTTLSCSKEESTLSQEWNLITFSEVNSPSYSHHLDKPHINFTFPSHLNSGKISIEEGRWYANGESFILIAHNWSDHPFILKIIEMGEVVEERVIDPLLPIDLEILLQEGHYSFEGAIRVGGVERKLYAVAMYGTHNSLEIK